MVDGMKGSLRRTPRQNVQGLMRLAAPVQGACSFPRTSMSLYVILIREDQNWLLW